ncbi:MAG: MDR family MFS transporter [Dehalococcoidia bacterium]
MSEMRPLAVDLSPRQKAVVVTGTLMALFVAAIDQTVVNTALPRIIGELGGLSLFSWVITAYLLTSTVTVPLAGKLSDLYGRKPFLMAGVVLFTVTSVFAGLSQSMVQLIMARAFQGVGAGLIMANAFATIGELFPPAQRARYQGLFAAVFGLSSILGPLVGGALTDHLSWRWVFLVNIPFGVAALLVLGLAFPNMRRPHGERHVDYAGGLMLIAVVVPLLLGLVWAGNRDYAWTSPRIVGLFATSAIALAAFIWIELRAVDPVLPPSLFRNRAFAMANLAAFFLGMVMFGVLSYMTLFVQGVLGMSATNSGVTLMPTTVGMVIASVISGQLLARVRVARPFLIAGAALLVGGMFLLSRMSEDTAYATAVRNMVLIGFGLGLTLPILNLVAQNALPYRQLGVASASSQFFRQIGGTLAVAVFGTLITSSVADLPDRLPPEAQDAPAPLLEQLREPNTLLSPEAVDRLRAGFADLGANGSQVFEQSLAIMRSMLADGITEVFFAGMLAAAALLVVTLLLPEVRLRTTVDFEEASVAAPAPAAGPTPEPLAGAALAEARPTAPRAGGGAS